MYHTSFAWCSMSGVLSTIASDHFVVARVASHRKRSLENVVARLHQHQDTLDFLLALLYGQPRPLADILDQLLLDDLAGAVEEVLHHVEELGIRRRGHVFQPLRDLVVGVAARVRLHGSRQDAHQHTSQNIVARRLLQSYRRTRETTHVKHLRVTKKYDDEDEEVEEKVVVKEDENNDENNDDDK